jgi:phosphoribosylformylglycinamidine cyclo-ligase
VARIKKHVQSTARHGAFGTLGGFGGLFDLGSLGYTNPVLVAGTDGVGTKIMLAFLVDKHDTIGIDVVAMCVNDVLVQGAEPLFFLDYLACGHNDPERIEAIVSGVAQGCIQAGCALIGGETAEMPGLYGPDEYDLAGFAVGACEKEQLIDGRNIEPGDVLLGLASSGLHSNGFSLVRKIVLEEAQINLHSYSEELGCSWAEELLRPTKIYVQSLLPLIRSGEVKGLAHITGGGFVENIPRMLPEDLGAVIRLDAWQPQPIFSLLAKLGQIALEEMYNIFNMGIGMVLAVAPSELGDVLEHFRQLGEAVYEIGRVEAGSGVRFL